MKSPKTTRAGRTRVAAAVAAAVLVVVLAALAVIHLRPASSQADSGASSPRARTPATHPHRPPATHPDRPSAPAAGPLAGKVVGIDPGHNGRNGADPSYIDHLIWNGRESEACDTTGTETDAGYTEAQFNFNVARYLRADLLRAGARVVMTRTSNDGIGPCVNRRAEILNHAHADVAIDIHADGGPPGGRGFTVLEPVADGPNDGVIASSERFGRDLRQEMLSDTPMPVSDYYGRDGIQFRDDLAGLNLTTVPKVLIECGNMRNAVDARLLTSAAFQKRLAAAFDAAITRFLTRA